MTIIAIISIVFIIETIIKLLEINHIKTKVYQGFLSDEQFSEFKNIALVEHKFSIITNFLALILNIVFILVLFDVLKVYFKPDSLLQNTALILAYFIINSTILSVVNYYKKMVIDTKHGFNKQTPSRYFKDLLKSLILLIIIGGALAYALLFAILKVGEFWWFAAAVIVFLFSLAAMIVYPNFIVPMFNKLSPIEGELKDEISELLNKCGFKSSGVFSMDASKNDTRLNAYFAGMFGTKKVVLYDTLINAMNKNELLAVLAHELGHFKNKDLVKMIFLTAVNLLILFGVFGLYDEYFSADLGLSDYLAGVIFGFIFVSNAISFLISPIINYFSRNNEYNADLNAKIMIGKDSMISALKVLSIKNKALLSHHPLYEAIYHSHPSLEKRLNALQ